jgi:hypothetical protein
LDNLIVDFALAILAVAAAATVCIGLRIVGFLADVLGCGSTGLAVYFVLLAFIHHPIPLSLLAEPRLQSHRLTNILVGGPLLVVALVGILSHDILVLRFEWAIPTYKPIHHGDEGLRRGPVAGQWHAGMVVHACELLDVDPPAPVLYLNGGLVLVV